MNGVYKNIFSADIRALKKNIKYGCFDKAKTEEPNEH